MAGFACFGTEQEKAPPARHTSTDRSSTGKPSLSHNARQPGYLDSHYWRTALLAVGTGNTLRSTRYTAGMNRTDRMLAILLELQARGHTRAEDLARRFEVSRRTIYRDVTALSEAGVPVIASPGSGYRLMEGYFLPPLSFTPEEAALLLLGARAIAGAVDEGAREAIRVALAKLEAVLPVAARERVEELRRTLWISGGWTTAEDAGKVGLLRSAILDRRVVHLRYVSPRAETPTERDIEPYALAFYSGTWHLTAWCRLREERRVFRVNRIDALTLSAERFEHNPAMAEAPPRREQERPLRVRVRFAPAMWRWVQEERHWGFEGEEPDSVMVFAVGSADDIVPWLLRWGAAAEVLEPAELRAAIAEAATSIANVYSAASAPLLT